MSIETTTAGLKFRTERRKLIREIATASTAEERATLAGRLHVLDTEAAARVASRRGFVGKAQALVATARAAAGRLLGTPKAQAATAPAPAPTPAPSVNGLPPLADNESPLEVSAFILACLTLSSEALTGRFGVEALNAEVAKVETFQRILAAVAAIDPSGKVLEDLDSPHAKTREQAARVLAPICRRAVTAPQASAPTGRPIPRRHFDAMTPEQRNAAIRNGSRITD